MPTDASPRHDLTITRTLDAPRALVFRVWTEPEHLAVWWGPHGFTNPECRADARPGGDIHIRMVGHGFDHVMEGTFVEVVPAERVVFDSWVRDDAGEVMFAIRNTITFADAPGGKTDLTMHARVTHAGPGSEFPLEGMEDGWTQSLERLQTYVAGIRETNVTPFLWFDGNAEDAARFYTSVFRNARILEETRYGEAGPGKPGSVMTITFEVNGLRFIALNGGPEFAFTPAVSFMVHCATQAEVDEYWEKLSAGGGKPIQCGWITDTFGVTWQIVPNALFALLNDPDPKKSQAVFRAMMAMVKIDEPTLREAYARA